MRDCTHAGQPRPGPRSLSLPWPWAWPRKFRSVSGGSSTTDCRGARGSLMNVNFALELEVEMLEPHGFTNYVKLFLLQTYQDTCTVPNWYMFALKYFKHIKQLYFVFYFVTNNVLDLPFIVESKCMYDYD